LKYKKYNTAGTVSKSNTTFFTHIHDRPLLQVAGYTSFRGKRLQSQWNDATSVFLTYNFIYLLVLNMKWQYNM